MKGTALVLLALTASAFTQDWTVAKCRATFEDRHKQLTAHFHGMTDTISDQFKSPIGKIPSHELLGWEKELDACVSSIDGERPLYRAVSRQLNEVLNDRFSQYILDAKEGPTLREWEQRKQSGETPQKQGPGR